MIPEIHEGLSYLIDVPPPTISGLLHMGHVFSYCHMDFIARYKRGYLTDSDMHKEGKDPLLYPFCFDVLWIGLSSEKSSFFLLENLSYCFRLA